MKIDGVQCDMKRRYSNREHEDADVMGGGYFALTTFVGINNRAARAADDRTKTLHCVHMWYADRSLAKLKMNCNDVNNPPFFNNKIIYKIVLAELNALSQERKVVEVVV